MKSYEIAYLIDSSKSAEDAITVAGGITKNIEDVGGSIQYVSEPKKRKSSFFINTQGYAYFGYTNFTLEPKKIIDLKKQLGDNKALVRFLIVEALKPNPNLREHAVHFRSSLHETSKPTSGFKGPKAGAMPEGQPTEKVDIEEIDKKLDEMLNK